MVQSAQKILLSLEEQTRRCRAEAPCVAGSCSRSLRRNWETRMRSLESKKEAAERHLGVARDRLDAERHAAGLARERLQSERQVTLATVEAVSRQRGSSTKVANSMQAQRASPPRQASPTRRPSSSGPSQASPSSPSRQRPQPARRPLQAGAAPGPSSARAGPPPSAGGASGVVIEGVSSARSSAAGGARSSSPPAMQRSPSGARIVTRQARSRPEGSTSKPRSESNAPSRTDSRQGAKSRSESPNGEPQGRAAWPMTEEMTEEELTFACEVLQGAEALQAKLAAMPEHLREQLARQHSGLRGLIDSQLPSDRGGATSSE